MMHRLSDPETSMRNLAAGAAILGLVMAVAPTSPAGAAEEDTPSRLLTPGGLNRS
jgi:hypothetical protein